MFSLSESSKRRVPTWLPVWLRERIATGVWWLVPLSLVISLAGGQRDWFFRAILAAVALVFLRLWDDLEDVMHDRLRHSKRVLCQCSATSLSQAYGFCAAGLTVSGILIAVAGERWFVFLAALFVVFVAARLRRRIHDSAQRVVFAHVILLKIPALVVSLAQSDVASNIVWGRAFGLAGFVGAYEIVHDVEARRSSWAPLVLVIDMVCLLWGLAKEIIEEAGA